MGSPSWKNLKTLKLQGELSKEQALLFQVPRPATELYDLKKDPWEVNNLVGNVKYKAVQKQLAEALESWKKKTGDVSPEMRRHVDVIKRF